MLSLMCRLRCHLSRDSFVAGVPTQVSTIKDGILGVTLSPICGCKTPLAPPRGGVPLWFSSSRQGVPGPDSDGLGILVEGPITQHRVEGVEASAG